VLCGFALMFFPDPQRALQEFRRVLKPGGSVGLTTWANESPMHKLSRDTLLPRLPPSEASGSAEMQRFDTKEKLEAALRTAGFEKAELLVEDHEFVYGGEDLLWQLLWSVGFRRYLEQMTTPALEETKADFYRRLQVFKQPDGIHAVYRALFAFAVRP
jgi:SAM-dependent methyltransferase